MVGKSYWMPPPRQFQQMFNEFRGSNQNTHNAKILRSMHTCVRPPSQTILRETCCGLRIRTGKVIARKA